MKNVLSILLCLLQIGIFRAYADDLWLRQENTSKVSVLCESHSPTIEIAKQELMNHWHGDDGKTIELVCKKSRKIEGDGFLLAPNKIQANTDVGVLYGVFELIRQQQSMKEPSFKIYNPSYELRLLNHWDNLDGSVERGYAGESIFWDGNYQVTDEKVDRWIQYARLNASIGINSTVLNNVNAAPEVLNADALNYVKTIANTLRPYGIKVFLSVNFASPMVIGGLSSSDPLDTKVIRWWKEKAHEIYELIPDFGGFLVKASSEGQPGPHNFGRSHVDGANMLGDVLQPYDGMIMWRAFVYSEKEEDRAKQAYTDFINFDGEFNDNVIVQVKNGPIDFQPREPFSPLFGAMKQSPIMAELQITQEYLGHSTHLVFLAPMWEEFLNTDTHQNGQGSTVAKCTDGTIYKHKQATAIAAVANTGVDENWCGHLFAQSNWYAFGRLAWDHTLSSEQIAEEWINMTFPTKVELENQWSLEFVDPIVEMMLESHEACVDYMMPLGLHHIFQEGHHYGPEPWFYDEDIRFDWTSLYYHRADSLGIGFDRSITGSNAVSQYHDNLTSVYGNIDRCPEKYLLWFHHVAWSNEMESGETLWNELCLHYDRGVKQVQEFQKTWAKIEPFVDAERFSAVEKKLTEHEEDAQIWKDACLLYFQQFSKMPFPKTIDLPTHKLEVLKTKEMRRL